MITIERADPDAVLGLRSRVLRVGRRQPGGHMRRDALPTTRHWVARAAGEVVGCVTVIAYRGFGLRGMAVAVERQRQGIGSLLLERVYTEVAAPMWCNARLDAVAFYARSGWAAEGPVFEIREEGHHQRMTWSGPVRA